MGQVLRRENIAQFVRNLQKSGKTVVATNGCFDILHVGHIRYLQKTKSFADYMVVLLNSDISVKKIKGEGRPINNENDRAEILAALNCVDFVVLFDEDSPAALLDEIKVIASQEPVTIGSYRNFELSAFFNTFTNKHNLVIRKNHYYTIEVGSDNFTRIENALQNLERRKEENERVLPVLKEELEMAKLENEYLKKLTALIQEDKQREKDSKNKKSESSKN